MQSGLFGKTSTAIPVIHNVGKIAGAELFSGNKELTSTLVAEHYEILFLTRGVGHCVADDLEQKCVIFAEIFAYITRIVLLKAGITADAVSAVAVFFIDEIGFLVLKISRAVFKPRLFKRGINNVGEFIVT